MKQVLFATGNARKISEATTSRLQYGTLETIRRVGQHRKTLKLAVNTPLD